MLGGVFFPVAVLPSWVQWLVELNPIAHAVRGLQLAMFQGVSVRDLGKELAALTLFAVLLVHIGQLFSVGESGGYALELQAMYLFTAIALVLTGAGRFSVGGRYGPLN